MNKNQLPIGKKKNFLSIFSLILMMSLSFTFNAKAADVDIFAASAFNALDASDGTADGTFNVTGNLHIYPGGSITGPGGIFGIKIAVTGDLLIDGTGSINGNQSCGSCAGINIDISVAGNVTLNTGASITSNGAAFGCGNGGNITIIAGTASSGGAIFTDAGSLIQANGCTGGAILIQTLNLSAIVDIDGTVESRGSMSGQSPNQPRGGGPITIIGGCTLIISATGLVSSQGQDPGADLVHLEACVVNVYGVVRSIGAGHALPHPTKTKLVPPNRPDKPANITAGVEIWAGDSLVIDQQTPGRNGEVYTDLSAGAGNTSWIDLFATGYISILGKTTACFNNPCSPTPPNTCFYAVHANNGGANNVGGTITVKSINGNVNENGRAIQTNGGFGGTGGHIVVQANLNIDLSSSLMAARGCTKNGGNMDIKSFNGDILSDAGTSMDVAGGNQGGPGTVTLTECGTTAFSGTVTPGPNPVPVTLACGGNPSLPCEQNPDPTCNCTCTPYVILPASCGGSCCAATITICKHVEICDPNVNPNAPPAIFDWNYTSNIPGFPVFTIHTTNNGNLTADGCITFNNLLAGTYTVTEVINAEYVPSTSCPSCISTTPTSVTFEVGCHDNDSARFTNIPDCQPNTECHWCNKGAVLSQVWQNMNGDTCAIPDILVDVRMPHNAANNIVTLSEIHTGIPATWSIQAAVDYVNLNGDPTPGDGQIFIGVTAANGTGPAKCGSSCSRPASGDTPYGTENVIINNVNPQRLNVFGCSVTMRAANVNLPVITIQDGVGKVTVLDIHVWNSTVAGYLIQNNSDLVVVKNSAAYYNDLGYDVNDDNVQITGSQHIRFNRIGILVRGNGNILRTNNDITNNTQDGIEIRGNFNESNGNEVGTNGKPNAEGVLISGNNNDIHDGDFNYNTTNGIRITGNNNFIEGNDVQRNGGKGFYVAGNNNWLEKNKQTKFNTGDGIFVSGIGNTLNENVAESNTGHGINADIANGASGNMLEQNEANDNSLQGIRACGQIDLGDNEGEDNGMDPQVAFTCPDPASAKFEVSDIDANKVYKYDASFNFISSAALTANNGDANDVADNGTKTYVLDKSDKQVYRYVGGNATSKTLKNKTGGSLNSPSGIAIYGDSLWIADGGAKKLYKYSLAAAFSGSGNLNALQEITFTNSGSVNNTNAEGLLIDAANLYVLDKGKKQFFRYPRNLTATTASKVMKDISGGGLGNPMGATLDGATVWIVDDSKLKAFSYSLGALFSGTGNLNATSQFALYSANEKPTGIAVGGISNFPRLSEEDASVVMPDHDALIQIYPNPTKANVTVQFMSTTSDQYTINVVDMAGRVVATYTDNAKEGMNVHEMDLRNVMPGMYMLIIQNPNMKEVKRIIVQK